MPIRSHVDLCMFVRVINVTKEKVNKEVLDTLEKSNLTEDEFNAWRSQYAKTGRLMFHEAYHFLQGLHLPFLHWYALSAFRNIFLAFREFNRNVPNLHDWQGFAPAFHLLDVEVHCWHIKDARFRLGDEDTPPPALFENKVVLTAIDLLEGATSVVEWQVDDGAKYGLDRLVSPKAFNIWCKRNPAYITAYRFVAKVLKSEELAVRCFVPMVYAAFHTTNPVRAFQTILALLTTYQQKADFQAFVSQREPCRWKELFEQILDQIQFDLEPDAEFGVSIPQPFFRLNLSTWVNASFGNSEIAHPILTPLARRWLEREKAEPGYSHILTQLPWVESKTASECWRDFQPPITIARFELENGRNRVFLVGEPARLAEQIQIPREGIADILTAYSVVRRGLGVHYDPDHRLCHHASCPEYSHNFCNSYPIVPERFQDCGFLARVKRLRTVIK